MSMLNRLTIRGIRNFGVDAEDEQKLTFTSPLTLILGPNGSGKTTIIECIKYALTGELPPNCKNGIGFINSPDILNITESLGQVKLRIKNQNGTETTICRSAKVLKRRNKNPQFKSLDSTITMIDENGRDIQISKRNQDATDDMTIAIGVSKAIISHVLFCHQEEANWPLGTDQDVMGKFDQIFGTTEYNNALDKMRKMRKGYESDIKDKKIALKEKEMIKLEAERMNMEITKHENEMKEMKAKHEQCKTDLQPLREEYERVNEIEKRLSSITASKTKVETELNNEKTNAQKLREKIPKLFNGSEAELAQEIESFNARHVQKYDELTENENALENAKQEHVQITKRHDEHDRKYHSLIQERQREQDLNDEKAEYIQKLCTDLNIVVDFDIKNDNNRAASLVANIRTSLNDEQEKINEIASKNEKNDTDLEQEIRGHREQEVRIKSEITSFDKQLNDLQQTLDTQKQELRKIEQNGKLLSDCQQKRRKIKETIDNYLQRRNTQNTQDEIAQKRNEKQKLAEELENVDEQITFLSSMATILAEVTTKEKHIEKRQSDVRRIKNKHADNLQRLFPDETIESNYKRTVESLGIKLQREINKFEAEVRFKENLIQTFKAQLQSKKNEQTTAEDELRKLQAKIDRVCEQVPFVELLASTKESVAKWQMEHSSYKSSEVFYKNYIKKMQNQPCCPLCHKDLNRNEVSDLTNELNDQIDMLPTNIERSEQALKEESIKLEQLLGMQSSVERVEYLKSTLIPKVLEEIKELETKLSTAQEKVKQSQRSAEEPKNNKSIVDIMISDMSILDDALRDIEQTRTDLEPLKREIQPSDDTSDYNFESLQQKRKDLSEQIKKLERDIEMKDKSYQNETKQINQLQERHMELQQHELSIQADLQNAESLRAREKEIIAQIKDLQEKKVASDHLLIPIEGKIRNAEEKRRRTRAQGAETYNNAMKRFDGHKKNFDTIERVSRELEKLSALNLESEIESYTTRLTRLRAEKTKQANLIETILEKVKLLNKEIAEQKNAERELCDNMELKKYEKKIEAKQKELDTLRKHEQEVDFHQILEKKAKIKNGMETIIMNGTRLDGQMKEKQIVMTNLSNQANQPKYRDSIRNYKIGYYENVVLTKTIEDLNTYCETLERALTKFHSDKMEKINSLIRDLWRSIYKGNDIDYIQINTEEVKGTTKRRSYTYRVVASKNDKFMDFRGQSSAGQRVLACLIIRIALAETFSGHCGVLALDEPTTNLDKVNIDSLCEALNKIVEEREGQRNFMLIVITHDEDFINSLGRVMSYIRVSRDTIGKSRLEKIRVR